MYAYLDASNDVVATSTTALTLQRAQELLPSVVKVVSGAPAGLVAKGQRAPTPPSSWHRLSSGNGLSISDYTTVDGYPYAYSISGDTAGSAVSEARLTEEIEESSISDSLQFIVIAGDLLDIFFDDALSSGDETTLNGLVAAHTGDPLRDWTHVVVDPLPEPLDAGVSRVVANDRPALEIVTGVTGLAAIQGNWPLAQADYAELRVTIKFILKATGTGSNVRLAARAKFHGSGDDSSATWDDSDFVAVAVTHTTLGEVFEGVITLDASDADLHDAVALQIGRDGNNTFGSGTNDDVNQAIQIIGFEVEGR